MFRSLNLASTQPFVIVPAGASALQTAETSSVEPLLPSQLTLFRDHRLRDTNEPTWERSKETTNIHLSLA